MNHPTSDIQFIAQMLIRVRDGDQIVHEEDVRLNDIATKGYSSVTDAPPAPIAPNMDEAELRRQHPGATRAGQL